MSEIRKIQRTKRAAFISIPAEYAAKMTEATHMKVFENEKGNLEYEVVKE